MSERDDHELVPRTFAPQLGGLAMAFVVIWALTGAGYFWPMWPALGLAMLLGAVVSARWARRPGRRARAEGQVLLYGVVGVACVAIWAMSGGGYFWPVWPMLGMGVPAALLLLGARPHETALAERVDELARTRRGALDVQATELRRIERDLHDGAQARLVALSMKLGRAEDRYREDPTTAALLREAREDATHAIRELRELARGIAPPVLADRGLVAAAQSLADRSGADVRVLGELERRPGAAVETAAYFLVAESLTNAAKHAPGASVEIRISELGGELWVEVTDFGPGGADINGSGLTGLRQRVEALDGRLAVTSRKDVGTQVEAVLPCGW